MPEEIKIIKCQECQGKGRLVVSRGMLTDTHETCTHCNGYKMCDTSCVQCVSTIGQEAPSMYDTYEGSAESIDKET